MLSWAVSSRVENLKALHYALVSFEKTLSLINSSQKLSGQQESEAILSDLMAEESGYEEMNEDEF